MAERHRISWFTAGMLMGVAIFIDLIQLVVASIGLIPIVGWLMAPLLGFLIGGFATGLLFMAWLFVFKFDLREFLGLRRAIWLAVTIVGELLPVISALPMWSIHTALLIRSVWREDKKHNAAVRKNLQAERETRQREAMQAANDNRPQTKQTYEEYPLAA